MDNTFYHENNLSGLKRADFQKTINGKETDLFILSNDNNAEIAVTNYGGAILTIMVPDKNGNIENVIQGHDTIENVINSPEPFLSTLIGRYGNRIAKGKFKLDGKEYNLTINNGPNSLHGGPTGFHARVWDAEQTSKQSVTLHYLSKDGEEGFPGNLDITVVYTLSNDNELIITYTAITDKKTLVNLTHHAFFSLSGVKAPTASVENNILTINALTAADTVLVPIQCEYYALEGLNQVLKTVDLVKRKLNPQLELEGVVFTMYDARTNLSLEVVESVKNNLNRTIYKTIIPRNVRLAEAPSHGLSINLYDSRSTGAESYRMLAAEVMSRGEEL